MWLAQLCEQPFLMSIPLESSPVSDETTSSLPTQILSTNARPELELQVQYLQGFTHGIIHRVFVVLEVVATI